MKTKFLAGIAAFCFAMYTNSHAQVSSQREIYDFEIGDVFQYRSTAYDEQYGLRRVHTIQLITGKSLSANRDTVVYDAIVWKIHAAYLYFTEPADIETPFRTAMRRTRLAYPLRDTMPAAKEHSYTFEDCGDTLVAIYAASESMIATYGKQCGILTMRNEKTFYQQLVDYRKSNATNTDICGCRRIAQKTEYFNHKTETIWRNMLGLPVYDL